jgi:hypothetical protein
VSDLESSASPSLLNPKTRNDHHYNQTLIEMDTEEIVSQHPEVTGFVEKITPHVIYGWILDEGRSKRLHLKLADHTFEIPIERRERVDVAEKFGDRHRYAGFVVWFPEEFAKNISAFQSKLSTIVVEVGGQRLPFVGGALTVCGALGNLDRCEMFQLEGWATIDGSRPRNLTLLCNGKRYLLKPVWVDRPDAAQVTGLLESKIGFQAELPGCIWDGVTDQAKLLTLALEADGHRIDGTVTLTKSQVCQWTEALMQSPSVDQYLAFCAIEHVHYAQLWPQLNPPAKEKLSVFAARFNLGSFLGSSLKKMDHFPSVPWPTRQLWRALRELNRSLTEPLDPQTFWAASMAVAETLHEQVRYRFYDSIIPSLCRLNLIDRLLTLDDVSPQRWLDRAESDDAWSLTIAAAVLAAKRRFDRVVALLWRLTQHLHKGWINTECLAYAAARAVDAFLMGRLSLAEIDKFIYAYLGVLDAFHGDWHSRLYDEALLAGALQLLRGIPRYSDWLRRDLLRGVLKHYGLLPHFWERSVALVPALADELLWKEAKQVAQAIFVWVDHSDVLENPAEIVASLRRFDRLGNPDARRYAREWLGQHLQGVNADPRHPGHLLLDLLTEEPTEGVRYAAFPLEQPNRLAAHHSACGEMAEEILRSLTQRKKDPRLLTYRRWGASVTKIAAAWQREPGACREQAAELWKECIAEAAGGDLLALDVAAWLAARLPNDFSAVQLLRPLCEYLERLPTGQKPSASFLAAFHRLRSRLPEPYAEEVESLMAEKVGHLPLAMSPVKDQRLSMFSASWPGDTLVVIYSCRKYLDSRIAAIRKTWLLDLQARKIPYLILVGDGNDAIEGDMLALAVSDRYEDLPQKTLKLIDWVYRHTEFQYLYKIDDDCYLDVARFFENLSYRKHHYYGRVIRRGEGSMDRLWHQGKSQSETAQRSIDKSPEPSTYADGGGGWCLSRLAMQTLLHALDTEAGQRLRACSFMEDKLVGDLLALQGIAPSDEEYESYQRRRTHSTAQPVGMWDNLFYPCPLTPTVMCHLDTEWDHAKVRLLRECRELWPKKVWPTCSKVRLDAEWREGETIGSNQLELLSPEERLYHLLDQHRPLVVAVMRNESLLLPHFLEHFRRLGVGGFLIADNCSDDGSREYLLEQPDVALFSADTEYRYSHYGVAWQQALLGNFCLNRWVVLADADEFLVYPRCEERPLGDFLAEVSADGADAVRIGMIDMYPYGDLGEADFTRHDPFQAAGWFDARPLIPWRLGSGYYSNATQFVSALRHRADPDAEPNAFSSVKVALIRYRPWMRFSQGLHGATGVHFAKDWAWFAHFKYHAGFKAKVAAEVARGQHFDNAKEYRRYAALLAEGRGRFGAEGISQRYLSSESFLKIAEELQNGA